jgi:hypothetical protein
MFIPERATVSFWESPCATKRDVRLARPDVGGGMLLLAPLKLAVVESRPPPNLDVPVGPAELQYINRCRFIDRFHFGFVLLHTCPSRRNDMNSR